MKTIFWNGTPLKRCGLTFLFQMMWPKINKTTFWGSIFIWRLLFKLLIAVSCPHALLFTKIRPCMPLFSLFFSNSLFSPFEFAILELVFFYFLKSISNIFLSKYHLFFLFTILIGVREIAGNFYKNCSWSLTTAKYELYFNRQCRRRGWRWAPD